MTEIEREGGRERRREGEKEGRREGGKEGDISRVSPRIDRIFPGEALNPFFGAQDEGFSEFRSR